MEMYDKRIGWMYKLIDTLFSIVRILCHTSFKKTLKIQKEHDHCLIMGNGPSLLDTLKEYQDKLDSYDLLAVNFMALTPQYLQYMPRIYVICDPAFWYKAGDEDCQNRVRAMYRIMVEKTDWPLQLYVPYQGKQIGMQLAGNFNIHVHFYNKTKFEGWEWLEYKIYNKQWGMVRAQNVLNAALMLSVYSEYKIITLMGADNNWLSQVWIDEENNVRSSDTHFYPEGHKKDVRNHSMKLHQFLLSQYFCFKSYADISQYASGRNVKIFNANPHSFIDAFEKKATE